MKSKRPEKKMEIKKIKTAYTNISSQFNSGSVKVCHESSKKKMCYNAMVYKFCRTSSVFTFSCAG
jgi:hypothetical protein